MAIKDLRNRTIVFVYGTLMRGECRNSSLRDQTFICDANTEPLYRLYLVDDYPGLIEVGRGSGVSVTGELWSVTDTNLELLDQIECVESGLYERRDIKLTGPIQTAEAWFYLLDVSQRYDIGTDWRTR
jgi:gamma-glutamylcyclotransferase (GGCT)/AIG2-like uncharacterized protein YtfP